MYSNSKLTGLRFLPGIRIGAYITLPIKAVDLKNKTIKQYPSLAVRTKNKKFGITYLLDIPDLLKVVQDWDNEVRTMLPDTGFWLAPLAPDIRESDLARNEVGKHREAIAGKNVKRLAK